jgi:hypothetical protein
MSPAVALASLLLAGPAPDTSVPPVEWLTDTDGVIEMLLAHRDEDRVDGGTLRLDRRKKLLTWTGAPNEIGCKRHFEVAFSDVKRVEADRVEAGFILELQAGKPRSWVLTPLPHVEHLLKGPAVHEGDLQHKANSLGLVDRDGAPLRMGGRAGGVGPDVRKREVPEQVQRDMDRAIRTLRDALGSPQG